MAKETKKNYSKHYWLNSEVKQVFKACKHEHLKPLLQALHWLPARKDYKLSTICHNFFSDSSPDYLSELLIVYTPSKQLRSSAYTRILRIPHTRTKTDATSPTVLQSKEILSLLTSALFTSPMLLKLG